MRHVRWFTALAAVATGLVFAATAAADKGDTLYVGHGAVGNNSSCASPGYNLVQAAVDAAGKEKKVYLCGAQFSEQVFISKSITLTGDSSSGLTAAGTTFTTSTARYPAHFASDNLFVPKALLVVTGGEPNVKGLTISGPITGNSGCAEQEFGILALAGGVNLKDDRVLNIADANPSLYGCQLGVGVQVGRYYWPTADFSAFPVEGFNSEADISNVTVSGYQKNGITVDGTGSDGEIKKSTVTGGGPGAPFGTIIAQNGIQVSRGADGNVHDNTVSNNAYSGPNFASSGGILVFGGCGDPLTPGVDVHDNTLTNNDVGIYLNNYSADPNCVAPAPTPTKDKAHDNTISNSAVTNTTGYDGTHGYQAGIDDVGNRDEITKNDISGAGYAPQDPPPAFVRPIDIVSFPTISPKVKGNTYNGNPYNG